MAVDTRDKRTQALHITLGGLSGLLPEPDAAVDDIDRAFLMTSYFVADAPSVPEDTPVNTDIPMPIRGRKQTGIIVVPGHARSVSRNIRGM